MTEFKPQFKAARAIADLTQAEAAERIGVSAQTLSSWENGASIPLVTQAVKMSDVYNIPLDQLCGIRSFV